MSARRAILTRELNDFLAQITAMHTNYGKVRIADIIAEGEHDALEFKSSLRWDIVQKQVNRELEKVVIKTIAAFNNGYGEGGRLIIGVDDEGNVLGLENDMSTLKGGDVDAFELHLRGLIHAEFGIDYGAANIAISFEEVGGKYVCVVNVAKGTKPLFVELIDKSGMKKEKFFVRSGCLSPPIENPSEITAYIASRFKMSAIQV